MKQTGRAVLIGETTAGGANPWHPLTLGHGLEFLIPNCEAKNPISRSNWEKIGVDPDVKVSRDEAFEVAKELLLRKIRKSH
jgi:C-terminal processing protease CtpA/Prc